MERDLPIASDSQSFLCPIHSAVLLLLAVILPSCAAPSGPARFGSSQASAGMPLVSSLSPPLPSTADPRAYYHFMLGYQAELAQDFARATREYRSALRGDPTSLFLKSRLAALYFSQGEMSNALTYADQVSSSELRDVSILLTLADIYAGAGHPDKALALYDRAIEASPTSSEPYFSKGVLLVNLKRLDEAERSFQAGVEKAKDSAVGYYYLGRIAAQAKQYDRAVVNFERAISAAPTFEPAYTALANAWESQQEWEKAAGVYKKYLHTVNPHHKEVRQHLVRLHLHARAYQEALGELDQMLREDPDDLDALLRAGLVYGELKQYQKAVSYLNRVLTERPAEVRVRDYLGLMYEELKEYDKAIQLYQTNIKLQPAHMESHLHLGFLLYRLKRFDEAMGSLSQAIALNPNQPDGHLLLGLTYAQREQYDLAARAFEAGVRQNPNSPDLYFNLGTAYDKLDRFGDMTRAMETALRLDPKHADALNYLGYSYVERGVKIEEAVELIKRALTLKPDNGYYVDSLAWAFYKMGRLDEALNELQRAASLVSDDPVIYEHMGEIYLRQNLPDQAKEAWLRSLALDPSNSKLMQQYKERGFGDPLLDERVREAKRRVSTPSAGAHPMTP